MIMGIAEIVAGSFYDGSSPFRFSCDGKPFRIPRGTLPPREQDVTCKLVLVLLFLQIE